MAIRNRDGSIFKLSDKNSLPSLYICKDLPDVNLVVEEPIEEEIIEPEKESNKLLGWCIPVEIVEEDSLYGTKKSVKYGEKFSTELILMDRSGLSCTFWAPIKKLEHGSIVYLWEEKEWWSVSETKEENNGLVVTCHPSEHTPSF